MITNLKATINYLKSDLIKKQRSFKIGLISIFLVVFFLTLLMNAIQLIPMIFIKLSEEQSGEIDLIFSPYLMNKNVESKKSGFDSFYYKKTSASDSNISLFDLSRLSFLNFYEVKEKIADFSYIEGVTPRWTFIGQVSSKEEVEKNSLEFSTNVIVLDSEEENNMGIARELILPQLKEHECYISKVLADALKLGINDNVAINIRLIELFKAFSGDESIQDENEENGENDSKPEQTFNLNNSINGSYGKNIFADKNNQFLKKIKKLINFDKIYFIFNEKINKNINNIRIKLIELIKKYFPNNKKSFDINNLPSFSLEKKYLKILFTKNSFIKKNPYVIKILKILFPNDNDFNENKNQENNDIFDDIITSIIIKQIFIYDEKSDLITINKKVLSNLFSENINKFTKKDINFENFFQLFPPFPFPIDFDNITQFLNFNLNLKIVDIIKGTSGKWTSALGNVVAIDNKHIKDYLISNIDRILDEILSVFGYDYMKNKIWNYISPYLETFDINYYALTVNTMFKDKYKIYKKSQKDMRHCISDIAGEITKLLGLNYQVNIQLPIYSIMKGLEIAKILLKDIFIGIMFFLWMLCVLLVYSLMIGNVDERIHEFGMLRSLGFKKNNLILLIIIQGFIFAIPGTIFGLITSYIANNYIAFLFNWYTNLVMPFFLSSSNLIFGFISGLSIPLISSYFPIKKCLDDNLRETLITFNKKIGNIVISIIKLENMGISPSTLILAITLIIIGILTYYLAPLNFLLLNTSLFLFIMIGILITMLISLIILIQLLVPYLQNFILKIIMLLSCKDRKLYLIVVKNLEGHKRRDQQVSFMFMIALGFVIFSGCTLNLIVDFVETLAKNLIGGDFKVLVNEPNSRNTTLNEISINKYLKNIKQNYPNLIHNYAYISWTSNEILSNENIKLNSRISPLCGYPIYGRRIIAIDKNFIDSTYTSLYKMSQYDKKLNKSYTYDDKIDIIKMLYENQNIPYLLNRETNNSFFYPENPNIEINQILGKFQLNMIASEGIRKYLAISVDNPGKLSFRSFFQNSIPVKIVGMASKLPGVSTYSSYVTIAQFSEVFISTDQMKKLIELESKIFQTNFGNVSNSTVDGVRKKQFILKYEKNVKKDLREMIYFGMNNYLNGLNCFKIQLDDVIGTSQKIKRVFEYIFLVLGIIALILSFFLIWTSFYNNIRDNIEEYCIMRSIGITKNQSIRIYLYEAATIILASIIIGTFIGVIISSFIILQFDVFIELPFIFNFPFKLYFILIFVGLFLGLLGSYYPTYIVNTLNLVKIMKGFNE